MDKEIQKNNQSLGLENKDLQIKFQTEINQIKTKHKEELLKLTTES